MGTPNSTNMQYRIIDLFKGDEEEKALARDSVALIQGLITKIRPILKYIAVTKLPNFNGSDQSCFGVCIADMPTDPITRAQKKLYLARNGAFLVFVIPSQIAPYTRPAGYASGNVSIEEEWLTTPFKGIIDGIHEALRAAEKAHQEHVDSIASRRTIVAKMMEALR